MIAWLFARLGYVPVHQLRQAEAISDSYAQFVTMLIPLEHALLDEVKRLRANGAARDEKGRFIRK